MNELFEFINTMVHNKNIKIYYKHRGKNLFQGYGKSNKKDLFECQTNGIISESIVQNWTLQALECYNLNSDCTNCPIKRANYSFKCQMKRIVDILIKTKGLPDEKAIKSQYNQEDETIVA